MTKTEGDSKFRGLIELQARGGDLVVALDPKQDLAIYSMKTMPDIIFWGVRVFSRVSDIRYEEGFPVTAMTKAP